MAFHTSCLGNSQIPKSPKNLLTIQCNMFPFIINASFVFYCFQIPHIFVMFPHFNIQNSFRVIKMHFFSSTDIFKVYQFSVITVLELAKPDKLTKIIHLCRCIMITIRFCFRISRIFSLTKLWYEIDMLFRKLFTCYWESFCPKTFPKLIHAFISLSTNPLWMLYTFSQTKCMFYQNIFQCRN